MDIKIYQFYQDLLGSNDRPMSIYDIHAELIKQKKILIEIQVCDDWCNWYYKIIMEDFVSPFFETYNSFDNNKEGFGSYDLALVDGLVNVYKQLNNVCKN